MIMERLVNFVTKIVKYYTCSVIINMKHKCINYGIEYCC